MNKRETNEYNVEIAHIQSRYAQQNSNNEMKKKNKATLFFHTTTVTHAQETLEYLDIIGVTN